MAASRLLATYLNDHLAGSLAGLELARRAAGSNRSDRSLPYGEALERLAAEIADDRGTLELIMEQLEVRKDRPKLVVGWATEKLGRLKLNGSWLSYSPLSRLEEIELLSLGIEAKLLLWQTLVHVPDIERRLVGVDLPALIKRARSQRRRLERYRISAAAEAIA